MNNDEKLRKMYDVFVNYDIDDNTTVNDKFLEMMSDYKNFNTLMNCAFGLDTSHLVNESSTIDDKRIVYNIKKFGPLYKNIYESYRKCFEYIEPKTFNAEEIKHKNAWNYLVDWYNANHNTSKDELKAVINMFMQNPDISSDGIKNALDTFIQFYKDSIPRRINEYQWNDMINIFMQKLSDSEDIKKIV